MNAWVPPPAQQSPQHATEMDVLLIRHCEVAARFRGVCYGRYDVALSRRGLQQSRNLANELASRPVRHVIHSGLQRTRYLAEWLGRQVDVQPECDVGWCERDYGTWELRSWDDVFAEAGDAMNGMLTAPDTYRPGNGETTSELRDRVLAALARLPATGELVVVVTHGGPMAAIRGVLRGVAVSEWSKLIPGLGEGMRLSGEPLREQPFPGTP